MEHHHLKVIKSYSLIYSIYFCSCGTSMEKRVKQASSGYAITSIFVAASKTVLNNILSIELQRCQLPTLSFYSDWDVGLRPSLISNPLFPQMQNDNNRIYLYIIRWVLDSKTVSGGENSETCLKNSIQALQERKEDANWKLERGHACQAENDNNTGKKMYLHPRHFYYNAGIHVSHARWIKLNAGATWEKNLNSGWFITLVGIVSFTLIQCRRYTKSTGMLGGLISMPVPLWILCRYHCELFKF